MHNLLELIKKEQNIYNIVFHELIRQVSQTVVKEEYMMIMLGIFSLFLHKKHMLWVLIRRHF